MINAKKVVDYLTRHQKQFWINVDEISREETQGIKERVAAAIGLSVSQLDAKIEAGTEETEEIKRTIKQRAQSIVRELQIRELNETIVALSDLLEAKNGNFYVLIDDLDENWGGEHTQYPLIRALLESLKKFKCIQNLKIVVAIREDLFEATIGATQDRHFQSEKFDGVLARIRWSPEQLHRVIELRINHLFAHRYTRKGVTLVEILPASIKNEEIRPYLVERTLRRPRDIIAFVNKILNVGGQGLDLPVPARLVAMAEPSYAWERLKALEQEWRSCHPLVQIYICTLAKAKKVLRLPDFDERRLTELVLSAADRPPADEVEHLATLVYDGDKADRLEKLAAALVCCLFKIGAIGVKLRPEEPYHFCYEEHATIGVAEVSENTKIVVHPMLRSVLGVHDTVSEAA